MNQYKLLEQKPPKSHKTHFHSLNLQWTHINILNKSLQNHTKTPFQFTKFTMNTYQHLTKNSTKSHKKPISINKIPNPTFTRMKLKTTKKKSRWHTHLFVHISLPSHDSSREQPGNLIEFGGLDFGGPNLGVLVA